MFEFFGEFGEFAGIVVVEVGVESELEIAFFAGREFLADEVDVFVLLLDFGVDGDSFELGFFEFGAELGGFLFEHGEDG